MALKFIVAIALFSSIIFLDLIFFFPAFVVILFILNSIEKDLKTKSAEHPVRFDGRKNIITFAQRDKKRNMHKRAHEPV